MSFGLQLNPASAPAPGSRPLDRHDWPRLYARLLGSRDIFELDRGADVTFVVYRRLAQNFGPRWHVWLELRGQAARSSPGRPPSCPAPALSAPPAVKIERFDP